MKELIEASIDREDTEIKEINFKIKEYKNEGNTFVYRDYKLTDFLPDNVSIEYFINLLELVSCGGNRTVFTECGCEVQ